MCNFYFQADVLAQTHISYPAKELLQLIHSHLLSQGLWLFSKFFFPGSGKNAISFLKLHEMLVVQAMPRLLSRTLEELDVFNRRSS